MTTYHPSLAGIPMPARIALAGTYTIHVDYTPSYTAYREDGE